MIQDALKYPTKVNTENLIKNQSYLWMYTNPFPLKLKYLYKNKDKYVFMKTNGKLEELDDFHARWYLQKIVDHNDFVNGATYQLSNKLLKFYNTPNNGPIWTQIKLNKEIPTKINYKRIRGITLIDENISQDVQLPDCLNKINTNNIENIKNVGITTTIFLAFTYFLNKILGN